MNTSRLENEYVSVDTTWYYRIQLERYEAVEYIKNTNEIPYDTVLYTIQIYYFDCNLYHDKRRL